MHFESKNLKSTHAINNPYMPPLVSPISTKVNRINSMLMQVDGVLNDDNFSSAGNG
jgi:hypothetical protein